MASRVKKIFHRKRDSDQGQSPKSNKSNPTLGTSLYESTSAAGQPQLGDYPIKGNDSSAMLQQGRKSSVRSRRSSGSQFNVPWRSPTPDQQGGRRTPALSSSPSHNPPAAEQSLAPYQHQTTGPVGGHGDRKRWSRAPLPQEFANLSLGNESPQTVIQTVTTTSFGPGPTQNRNNQQKPNGVPSASSIPPRIQSALQSQNTTSDPRQGSAPSVATRAYHDTSIQQDHENDLTRKNSIPRKQVGKVATPLDSKSNPSSPQSVHANYEQQANDAKRGSLSGKAPNTAATIRKVDQPRTDRDQRAVDGKIASTAQVPFRDNPTMRKAEVSQASGNLDGNRPMSGRATAPQDAQTIVDRAKSNTYDTQVAESVAPAVTHETVHRKIHKVREELITKEIHTHDVYHRILPVIDVEVLPPRHFLPVEGGGLVEVSASEVPGRGTNWVIAETASKIPSDQPAPKGTRGFTAREFPGREGDAVTRNVDDHERTEETWVHPPELATGARDTGQSWPMVFGSGKSGKADYGSTSAGASKRERSGRSSIRHSGRARHADKMGMAQ